MAKQASRVSILKQRYQSLFAEKQLWYPMYQLIGEYVMERKQNFQVSPQPGEFLTEQLFSSLAPTANQTMASSLLGNLWPNGARSIRLMRPRNIPDTKENKEYFEQATEIFTDILDDPYTGVIPAFQEYMLDQGAFGISGVQVKKTGDLTDPLRVFAANVKYFVIDENKDGLVDTVFLEYEYTASQAVEEYGFSKVSPRIKDAYKQNDISTKFKIIHLIEPRKTKTTGKGNKSYPILSLHFELDSEIELKESGYAEMPIIISRFLKALGEKYGRSPAMFAMPAIARLNVVWELLQRAGEKKLNPPLYLLDNGALGSDTIDTSPSAVNVFSVLGVGERSPVGQLFDVGNLQDIYPIAESLATDITKAFYIDKLMDLNNETRMTLGEAQIRDRIRGEGLSSVFKRQEAEFFSRFISVCFNMLLEDGLMGVVRGSPQEKAILKAGMVPLYIPPDVLRAMKQGQKVYKIKFISPAARIMRVEELQGLTQAMDYAIGGAQAFPEILDGLDPDKMRNKIIELTGTDEEVLRDSKTIQDIRAARAEFQKQQMQIQQAEMGARIGMQVAQAQSMREGAISGRPRG
ncbi:MAG: hypothetical protein GX638_18815 [Crenarchaeota archaeon]|nr:hypothetical protein [Thermoproteota archaeon]